MPSSEETETLLEALLQNDRYAGLGILTGGLIHAVNNQLGAILGYSELLQLNPAAEIFKSELEQIVLSCTNGIELVRGLALMRNSLAHETNTVDAAKLLNALLMILSRLYNNQGIKVERDISDSLLVSGDPVLFSQAVYHQLQLTFKAVGLQPPNNRRFSVTLSGEPAAGSVTITAPAECFHVPMATASPPPPDQPAYDWWVMSKICRGGMSYKATPDGRNLTLQWRFTESGGKRKFVV
jgi:C4-dicarboxylate-specific signal transduction histidine kinase